MSDMVPGLVADMGPKLFGIHFPDFSQMQLQILGVAYAAQLYVFKSKNPNAALDSLAKSLWLSRPFYAQFLRQIRRNVSSSAVLSSGALAPSPCPHRDSDESAVGQSELLDQNIHSDVERALTPTPNHTRVSGSASVELLISREGESQSWSGVAVCNALLCSSNLDMEI